VVLWFLHTIFKNNKHCFNILRFRLVVIFLSETSSFKIANSFVLILYYFDFFSDEFSSISLHFQVSNSWFFITLTFFRDGLFSISLHFQLFNSWFFITLTSSEMGFSRFHYIRITIRRETMQTLMFFSSKSIHEKISTLKVFNCWFCLLYHVQLDNLVKFSLLVHQ